MKKMLMIAMAVGGSVMLYGANLLENGECDNPSGYFADGNPCIAVSQEKDGDNACAKLTLKAIKLGEDGRKTLGGKMIFGGTKYEAGIQIKPDTEYKFSFRYRSTAPVCFISSAQVRAGDGPWYTRVKYVSCSPRHVAAAEKWTEVSGTFKTGKDVSRAALCFEFWGDSKLQSKFADWTEGMYVVVDGLTLEEAAGE